MNSVQLNFINRSNDANNSEIVIFQKNEVPAFSEIAVAWQVIRNCGIGDNHPFDFPFEVAVAASDSWGNFSPLFPAQAGQAFAMIRSASGDQLVSNGNSNSPEEIDVQNNLPMGAVNAWIYRGGKKLATKTNVAPGQMAAFVFKPSIYIGAVLQVEEGEVMNSAILSQINCQISLLGIQSADIVMTGGGIGPEATPFRFTLENIVMV